jgi:hypothetical protein
LSFAAAEIGRDGHGLGANRHYPPDDKARGPPACNPPPPGESTKGEGAALADGRAAARNSTLLMAQPFEATVAARGH